jgi:hypothetical protein
MPVLEMKIRLGIELERAPATALGVRKRRVRTGAPVTAGARAVVGWWCPDDLVRSAWETERRLVTLLLLLLLCWQRHEEESEEAG